MVEVHIEAAARALERAASKVSDPQLRQVLLQKASEIRTLLSSTSSSSTSTTTSLESVLEEIRKVIWSRTEETRPEVTIERGIELFAGIVRFFVELEERLKKLDEVMSRLLP